MNTLQIYNIHMLFLLWLLPLLIGLFMFASWKRRNALERFAEAGLLPHLSISVSITKRRWKAALVIIAAALAIIALARPAWNPKPKTVERRGRDVVFVLDVSRSMLAEDLAPNRLERAKLAIQDCTERLEGDRVGLIAFAGAAVVKCPLTLDYGFFRMMLRTIDTESISRGGTMIGDAIRKAVDEVFDDQQKKYKDIILITDGEDHESFPIEAAKEAGEKGVRIIAIGLGDENEGRRIPVTDELGRKTFLKYQGREIWSRLDAETLRKMVNVTSGGKYFNVATGAIDLGEVYMKVIAAAEKKELEAKTIKRFEDKFQIFIAAAFLLLCVEMTIREKKTNKIHDNPAV